MFPLRICRSGLWRHRNKVTQRKKSTLAALDHSPGAVGVNINRPQQDVSHRDRHLPHAITTPLLENSPKIQKLKSFLISVFPQIINDIKTTPEYQEIPEYMDRIIKVLERNVPGGKGHRAISILNGYMLLMEEERQKPSQEEMEKVAKCCWCMEMMQWFMLEIDDIIDDSDERRNMPTWFKMPGIGLTAINDAITVENYVYELCKKYFNKHPSYVTLIELFHRAVYIVHLGQGFDQATKDIVTNRVKFEMFNMEKLRYLVKYKTTRFVSGNILRFALALANKYDPRKVKQVQPILDELGYFFELHNACKDFYRNQGDLITDDKIFLGTDIPLGKMTWFVVRALEKGSSRQKKIIYDHYGKENQESIEEVLKVYRELELMKELVEYEEKSFKWVCEKTLELNNVISNDFFHYLISTTYRRDPRLIWEN